MTDRTCQSNSVGIVFLLICLVIVLVCLFNQFLSKSRSPTLFDDMRSWPLDRINNVLLTYCMLVLSMLVTLVSSLLFYILQDVLLLKEASRRYILLLYICLELTLRIVDKSRGTDARYFKHVCYFAWCAMFAPVVCLFETHTAHLAVKRTLLILLASSAIAHFWNVEFQRRFMKRSVVSLLVLYIPLSVFSVLLVVFGIPRSLIGLTIVAFTLHFGFIFHIVMFIISTQLFLASAKEDNHDKVLSTVDLYVCTMHMFIRLMIFNTYKYYIKNN